MQPSYNPTAMLGGAKAYAVTIKQAADDAPVKVGSPLKDAIDAVLASLDGCQQAQVACAGRFRASLDATPA